MKDLVKFFDGLPWIVKLIFALPGLDGILWGIYRIAKGLSTNNTMLVIIGILWIVLGFAILWIIDIVSILLNKKLVWFV
ncbi:MAG TPA: hypothetical protein PLP48_08070 [Acholeplasmataceae bacterium]|jgi:hypothetical protein|nr:hypothetical protein [Acholeplasmataceae bacterium]